MCEDSELCKAIDKDLAKVCWDEYEQEFIRIFDGMQEYVHKTAVEHGFHEGEVNVPEKIALMHSELSEALEGYRHGNPPDEHCPDLSSLEVELADAVIRIMDLGGRLGLRLSDAILAKAKFNQSRPYKHGKKF